MNQPRSEDTRRRLLQAALREFSAYGLHGARIDRIARAAGANKQRIYAYFQDKDGLYTAVLQSCFSLIAHEEAGLSHLTPDDAERLPELLLRHYMTFHDTVPHFWRLLAWENLEGGAHAARLESTRTTLFTHLRAIYQHGQTRGIFAGEVSFETFIFVLSAISFFYHANLHTMSRTLGIDLPDAAVRERVVRESLALLAQGGR